MVHQVQNTSIHLCAEHLATMAPHRDALSAPGSRYLLQPLITPTRFDDVQKPWLSFIIHRRTGRLLCQLATPRARPAAHSALSRALRRNSALHLDRKFPIQQQCLGRNRLVGTAARAAEMAVLS